MGQIKTFTGIMFDPANPEADKINATDIAHALSMLCRANGHFKTFYSVGQHCINCAREAAARGLSRRIQLGCLLHDGSEAYLSDVTRPVKEALPKYLEIEEPLQEIIWAKWIPDALTEEERKEIFAIDDIMLLNEFQMLMNTSLAPEIPMLFSKAEFAFIGFQETQTAFLELLDTLCWEQKI